MVEDRLSSLSARRRRAEEVGGWRLAATAGRMPADRPARRRRSRASATVVTSAMPRFPRERESHPWWRTGSPACPRAAGALRRTLCAATGSGVFIVCRFSSRGGVPAHAVRRYGLRRFSSFHRFGAGVGGRRARSSQSKTRAPVSRPGPFAAVTAWVTRTGDRRRKDTCAGAGSCPGSTRWWPWWAGRTAAPSASALPQPEPW
jgi:hypothetical protein